MGRGAGEMAEGFQKENCISDLVCVCECLCVCVNMHHGVSVFSSCHTMTLPYSALQQYVLICLSDIGYRTYNRNNVCSGSAATAQAAQLGRLVFHNGPGCGAEFGPVC